MRSLFKFLAALAVAWALPAAAAIGDDDYYIACSSMGSRAYTTTGRGIGYVARVRIEDLRKLGISDDEMISVVIRRFGAWAKATGQYGRWNSISDSSFDCSAADRDSAERSRAAMAADEERDWHDMRLPPDWYKRDPSAAPRAEIAQYSVSGAAPGSDQADEGGLIIAAATPPVQPGWDEQVREQLRKDAESRARAASETLRNAAETRAQADKFFAEMKKRGSAQ